MEQMLNMFIHTQKLLSSIELMRKVAVFNFGNTKIGRASCRERV